MIGTVDAHGRALLEIHIRSTKGAMPAPVTVWIDTAFDGHLVFPRELIKELELELLAETDAILADGSQVVLETFLCFIEWFAKVLPLQVIANDGRFPLLGTGLLDQHVLCVNYQQRSLTLE